jgi:hypothetical protein
VSASAGHATAAGAPSREQAQAAVERLSEMSADARGCALLGPGGELVAASGDPGRWREPAAGFLRAADAAGEGPAAHVHVATEDGEVFAVRRDGVAMVAVAERFALASLMLHDMRVVLRELDAERD